MAKVFSPGSSGVVVDIVALDQAAAAPTILTWGYVNGNVEGTLGLPTTDFDGSPLTGLNDAYVTAAFANTDGSFPNDSMGGADAVAAYGRFTVPVTPEMAALGDPVPFSFPQDSVPGGATMNLVAFVSDGVA